MRRVPSDVPAWPVWMAPAAIAGTWFAGWLAGIAVAIGLAVRGAERLDAPSLLLLVALAGAGAVAVVVSLGARVAAPRRAAFGLRRVPLRLAAVGVGVAGLAVASAAVAAALLGDAFGALSAPVELSQQSAWARALGEPDPTVVDPGAAAACSVVARALIGPLCAELLLRGFVLPILARRFGARPAIALLAPLSALAFAGAGRSAWLLLPGLALGVVLCLLYLETGSILPGSALAAAWSGLVLGLAFRWDVGEATLLALACGAAAIAAGLLATSSGRGLQSVENWRSPNRSSAT